MENFELDAQKYLDTENFTKLQNFIEKIQEQNTSENYLNNSLEIAHILLPLRLDFDTYSACILLPFLREEFVFTEDFLSTYAEQIALTQSVIKISNFDYTSQQTEMDNIRSMLLAIAKDIRVMIIRLAEVLNEARHTKDLPPEKAKKLHFEIKEIYSPIASRLGLSFIKSELNDLNIFYYHPNAYKKLLKQVAETTRNGAKRINSVIEKVKQIMQKLGIQGDCYGRVKHISSLYNKLQEKGKTISQIYDLCALRVLVPEKNDCYAIMSAIHTEFVPLNGRFKDYIIRPKANGYQSLHTVVLVEDEPLEIQIRTFEMHNHAEYGIAAHFLYKEHKNKLQATDDKLLWIRKLLENKDNNSASNLIEELKTDVYSGEIFVQTPLGKVIQLVENSTPIDFAYAIHSEVGNKCVGAKINGKMMPLSTTLDNGDVVEIITSQNAKGPSRDWLKIAKSSNARNRINQFFRHEMKEENIKKGKSILELAAKTKGYNLKDLMDEKWLIDVLEKYAFHTEDEMFASLGYGSITSTQIVNKLIDCYTKNGQKQDSDLPKIVTEKVITNKDDISELGGMLVKYAKCCSPVPGDEIKGYISRGSGVTIHRADCQALASLEQDRLIDVTWGENSYNNGSYQASLRLFVDNKPGVLASISTKISENKINITKIVSLPSNNKEAIIDIAFYVSSKQQLDDFINKLSALSIVNNIVRGGK